MKYINSPTKDYIRKCYENPLLHSIALLVPIAKEDTFLRILQIQYFGTLYPVCLRRTHTPRSRGFQRLVKLSHVIWDLAAVLKMESLHISNGLIDPRDRRGITNGPFSSILCTQMGAMEAPNAHLTEAQLLRTLGVTSGNIFFGCCKDFHELRADEALAIRERIGISWQGQQHSALVVRVRVRMMYHVMAVIIHWVLLESR